MLDLNLDFLEEYKSLDNLCKDYLSSAEGVSEYIRRMDAAPWSDRRYVFTFENDYKQLKHVRHIRNQLAHEIGVINSDICTEDDLEWVRSFHERIIAGDDPFTVIRKAKVPKSPRTTQQTPEIPPPPTYTATSDRPSAKPSVWRRLIANIKKLFS